jgi:hypothetical protein
MEIRSNDAFYHQKTVPSKTILLSGPGLRQDTLLALVKSLPEIGEVVSTGSLEECVLTLERNDQALVVIDHTLSEQKLNHAVALIREKNPKAWILMLVGHPRDTFAFTNSRPDSILCEGFTSTSLLEVIHKAFPDEERV